MIRFKGDSQVYKPRVFVGSSKEGLEVARAVQVQLSDVGEPDVWNEGVFGLTSGTLESLVQALDTFEFALLVLSRDDLTVSHGLAQNSARDNVLIELGLFIGRLGRGRTFVLYAKDSGVKIPSDLAGVTLAEFSMPADPNRLESAVGPACYRIRQAIRAQSKTIEVERLAQTVEVQQKRVEQQAADIRAIRVALRGIVTKWEIDCLRSLARVDPWKCRWDQDTFNRLKRLDDMGFVLPTEIDGTRSFERFRERFQTEKSLDEREWFDMKQFWEITEDGKNYLELYDTVGKDT
jgi:CAP12/Pycsar effector protein, TIR domain